MRLRACRRRNSFLLTIFFWSLLVTLLVVSFRSRIYKLTKKLKHITFKTEYETSLKRKLPFSKVIIKKTHVVKDPTQRYVLLKTPKMNKPFSNIELEEIFLNTQCPDHNCFLTDDKGYLKDETEFDAVIFGPDAFANPEKLPKRRSPNQKYIFVSTKSAQAYPVCSDKFDDFFNWTWTYRLDSEIFHGVVIRDYNMTIIGPSNDITWVPPTGRKKDKFLLPRRLKSLLTNKTKAVAWISTECDTLSHRETVALKLKEELKKYALTLDIYGKCGDFKCESYGSCNRILEKDYYFYLAFEDAYSEDYVTDELVRALRYNVVPIVYGGANYTRFLPTYSYLDASNLPVEALAGKIHLLITAEIESYNRHFWWKAYYLYSKTPYSLDTNEFCKLCKLLNSNTSVNKQSYTNFKEWWNPRKDPCNTSIENKTETEEVPAENVKYILQWITPRTKSCQSLGTGQKPFIKRNCSEQRCFLTTNSSYLKDVKDFDAILFHGSELNMNSTSLPGNRSPHQKYIFVSRESSQKYPVCDTKFNGFFNWTWTYRLDSDISFSFINVRDANRTIVGPKAEMRWMNEEDMLPVQDNDVKIIEEKRKATAWVVTSCGSLTKREALVRDLKKELSKYNLQLEIYGDCYSDLCPEYIKDLYGDILQYNFYFYLAFEDSFNEDYVTDTLLTALNHFLVPVVYGGANYSRFLPESAYLDLAALGIEELAKQMKDILDEKEHYYRFFEWRNHYSYMRPEESFDAAVCGLCAAVNNESLNGQRKKYDDFVHWWNSGSGQCQT